MNKNEIPPTPNVGGEDYHVGEKAITECLESKRIGFKEISEMTSAQVFEKAPKDETFTVPDDRYKAVYEDRAKRVGRKDLKFVVGE